MPASTLAPLYLVIVHSIAGGPPIAGSTTGPLTISQDECSSRAARLTQAYRDQWHDSAHAAAFRSIDPRSGPASMQFICRRLLVRPDRGDAWTDPAVPLIFPDHLR